MTVDYWTWDPTSSARCPACDWTGTGDQGGKELFDAVFEVRCPSCTTRIQTVAYPTRAETRARAEAGDPRAVEQMATVEKVEARDRLLAESPRLVTPEQLPDLPGTELHVHWSVHELGAPWIVISNGARELWREPTWWENHERFSEIMQVVRARYGDRLASIEVDTVGGYWLYGDRYTAPDVVMAANAPLAGPDIDGISSTGPPSI